MAAVPPWQMSIRPASEAWVDDDDGGGEMKTKGEGCGYLFDKGEED